MADLVPNVTCCRICGQVIRADELFFRDDPRSGEGRYPDRWVHRLCLYDEATEAFKRSMAARGLGVRP